MTRNGGPAAEGKSGEEVAQNVQSGGGAVDRCSAVGRPLQTERAKRGFFGSGRSTVGLGAVDRWRRQRDWCSGERVFPRVVKGQMS